MIWVIAPAAVAAGAGLVWWLRRRYLIVTVHGRSMLPTYADGDRVLVRRRPAGRPVRAGDAVVADLQHWPPAGVGPSGVSPPAGAWLPGSRSTGSGLTGSGMTGSGLPGVRGAAARPPEPAADRVVKRVAAGPGDPVPPGIGTTDPTVPAGMVVLLGDNPAESADSRQFGYVPAELVIGVVLRHLR